VFDYQWSMAAVGEHLVCLLPILMLFLGAVSLAVYLAGGKRFWLIVSVVFGAVAIACLLFMPAADREKFYFYEFFAYRHLLGGKYYTKLPEMVLKALKYVPIVGSMALSAVGFVLDRQLQQE
jgi:hypothetical protein